MNVSARTPGLPCLMAVLVVAAACCRSTAPEKPVVHPSPAPMAEFWAEPADVAARDLLNGEGGAALAPDPSGRFTFLRAKRTGESPGYVVTDAKGVTWSAKMGVEAQAEVAVSRIVWAIGFRQPPVYLLPTWTLEGGPDPGVKGPTRFRPELPGWRDSGSWLWRDNPFRRTPPWRGLIVLMRLVNNWDILDRNNTLYELDPPREGVARYYVVKDLGASLGRSTFPHQGTKNDARDFQAQPFVGKVEGGIVQFDDRGRRHHDLYENISVEDVRWTCERLARLTPQQWLDAFRAARYDQETAAQIIGRLHQKIDEGRALR